MVFISGAEITKERKDRKLTSFNNRLVAIIEIGMASITKTIFP